MKTLVAYLADGGCSYFEIEGDYSGTDGTHLDQDTEHNGVIL